MRVIRMNPVMMKIMTRIANTIITIKMTRHDINELFFVLFTMHPINAIIINQRNAQDNSYT
jgi:hypothetical protein